MKHTPAPWIISEENGMIIGIWPSDKSGPYVAAVRYSDNPKATLEIAKANAKLIAAAPELLEALEYIVNNQDMDSSVKKAIAAIKKAKGE